MPSLWRVPVYKAGRRRVKVIKTDISGTKDGVKKTVPHFREPVQKR